MFTDFLTDTMNYKTANRDVDPDATIRLLFWIPTITNDLATSCDLNGEKAETMIQMYMTTRNIN